MLLVWVLQVVAEGPLLQLPKGRTDGLQRQSSLRGGQPIYQKAISRNEIAFPGGQVEEQHQRENLREQCPDTEQAMALPEALP